MSIWDDYEITEKVGDGLVFIRRTGIGGEISCVLWGETKARKARPCSASGEPIKSGDRIYRPIGNQMFRGERILAKHVEDTPTGWSIA